MKQFRNLLMVALCFCALSKANAQTWNIGSPNAADVTATLNDDTLTISGTGKMMDFEMTSNNEPNTPWFSLSGDVTCVIIDSGVTHIGDHSFNQCEALSSVSIPNSVTTIGSFAFIGSGLTSIYIPKTVIGIGTVAFSSCANLEEFNVDPENPNYSSLDGVLFDKAQTILFCYPSSKAGSSYIIPGTVTVLVASSFLSCENLTSINIPASVTTIEASAFSNCNGLSSFSVDTSNSAYSSLDGVLFNKAQTRLEIFPAGKAVPHYVVPGTVTHIAASSFMLCYNVLSVTFPNSVKVIEPIAFGFCLGLKSVRIGDSVTSIGMMAFASCYFLDTVICLAPTPPSLGLNAFDGISPTAKFYVPCPSEPAYEVAQVWKDFNYGLCIEVLGVQNVETAKSELYPNPVRDNLTISLPENAVSATFTLYDMQGRELLKQQIDNNNVISVSDLSSGIYTYSVLVDGKYQQGKLSIVK